MSASQDRDSFYDQLLSASIFPDFEGLSKLATNDFFHDSNKIDWVLEKALVNKDTRIIVFLLASGLGIHRLNDANQTALHLAVRHDYLDIVDTLFDHCKINCRDVHGLTHFHVACIAGNVEMAKHFLSNGVDVDVVETKDFFTPLHFAVAYRRIKVIELLLKNGADPNALDRCYRTPLHLVCLDHSRVVAKKRSIDRVAVDDELRILELLIEFGSDVNSKDQVGDTPLMCVFKDSYPERVFSQMHCGEVEKRKVLDDYRQLQKRKVELLLRSKANVRQVNGDDETALHVVISDIRRSRASCKLHYLDDAVNVEVADLLLKHGARVNARNKRNETPLQIAVSIMSLGTVKILLSHDAEVQVLRFEEGCFHYSAADDLPCLEVTESLIGIVEVLRDRGFQMSPGDNLAVLNFFVPNNERFCRGHRKDKDAAYKMMNLLEYGTSEIIQSALNNFPANLDDTSLPEQFSRKHVIQQIQLYLSTLTIGKLYLDDGTRQYLQEKLLNLRKYLLGFMFTSDTTNQTYLTSLQNEVQLMKSTMLTKYSSLHDTLRKNPHKIRSRELSSILKSQDFSNRFSRCIGIIKGHCTKGLIRHYVSQSAEECLSSMLEVRLPHLCCERICEYLNNESLVNVCTAAAIGESNREMTISDGTRSGA
ncbi:uncharacterized protein LOC100678374 [Nasonia vitripennis]|uniref:Uncharacterized protein n=1 Tax=Nasonia vitripennis TaxID=7425 RepID=A0A7M7GDS0_NASVI|nr:uncharacterized protein LOC100678374 [Nasonia vitripennis]XP_031785581.1 uncharacterized protein LOC100678374 [Nasonia vitripennis]